MPLAVVALSDCVFAAPVRDRRFRGGIGIVGDRFDAGIAQTFCRAVADAGEENGAAVGEGAKDGFALVLVAKTALAVMLDGAVFEEGDVSPLTR